MELGEIIKEHRERRGLTQTELARLAGVSASFVSRIESGQYKFTSPESLGGLARALKLSINALTTAILSNKFLVKDSPPRSIRDYTIKELQTNIIEIPVVAELHMPGEIQEYILLARPRPGPVNYVGIRAKGYCLEPEILDGDTLIIDKDAVPEPGKTILCYHNGHSQPQLIKYKKQIDLKDCEIYGVVISINRRM